MSWNENEDDDDLLEDLAEEAPRPKKKIKYPKCFIDKKHDSDPICKECALALYEVLPKKKYKFPRNCWNCEELGVTDVEDEDFEEPFYEE